MLNFKKEFDKLNTFQKKAVENIYWPTMVVAWPGTGKTQIIWLRTANILLKTWINPQNILITTFTDAWVIAIKKRLENFLWSEWHKVMVCTIHSFCQDVINTFPEKFLFFKAWNLIDEVDSLEILKNIIDEEITNKNIKLLTNDNDRFFYLKDIRSYISTLKQEWVRNKDFENIIQKQKEFHEEILSEIKPTLKKYEKTKLKQEKYINKLEEINLIYEKYNSYLRQNWYYDFNDMINFVLDVLESDEDLRYFYAEKYQFIMLDEFQDTNNAQNKIINLILSVSDEKPNIMVVWDDDQSIYRFAWANIENMLEFSSKFVDTKIIVLENNYRSSQKILDLCSNLIDHNNERLSKKVPNITKRLISSNSNLKNLEIKPVLVECLNDKQEKFFLLKKVNSFLQKWISPNEIAIIVRNNKEVEELSNFFTSQNIDVVSKLNFDILKNNYVNFILKFLACLSDPLSNDNNFIDITRSSIIGLNQVDIFKFTKYLYNLNYTRKFKLSFYDRFCDIQNIELDFSDKDSLINFRDIFEDLRLKLNNLNFVDFFSYFIDKIWIIPYIEKHWNFDDIEDIYTLFNKIKSFIAIKPTLTVKDFLNKIDLYKKYGYTIQRQILKSKKIWINILTAHSSKWLEYEVVFIPWLYNGNWDKRSLNKFKLPKEIAWLWLQQEVDNIEEERRLFFVACSRAKKYLYFSFPMEIENKLKLASSFLGEIEWFFDRISFKIKDQDDDFENMIKKELINFNIVKYSDAEFDYIKEFLWNYRLSPTDLNIFIEDPLKFLQNVVFKYPFVDNEATIFWKVYHRVLELFYSRFKENKKMDDLNYLIFTFKVLLEKEVLKPESFQKLLEKWITWLTGFYDTYKNNKRDIVALEYNFRSKWISFKWIPITWKIDKIEIIWKNEWFWVDFRWQLGFFKEAVLLVDYKTWKPKSINEIKWIDKNWNRKPWEWKYARQLMFYKLLTDLDVDFTSKYYVRWLAIDFVEWRDWVYKLVELDYTEEEYEYFKNELIDARSKISNIEFWREILGK